MVFNRKRYMKEWKERNKDKIAKTEKEYYEKNKDNIKKANKKWRSKNKEKVWGYVKKWRENNREKYLLIQKKSREKNKDKNKEKAKKYYQENKEELLEKNKIYREKNKDKKVIYDKNYQKNNRKWLSEKDKLRKKKKYHSNKNFKLICNLRNGFNQALKLYTKTGKIMTSKKYGVDYRAIIEHLKPLPENLKDYDIHHIKPLHTFNFENSDGTQNLEEIRKANMPENHKLLTIEEHKRIHQYNGFKPF